MEVMSFKGFFFFFSIFSSVRHFVQPSIPILAISVEGHWQKTSVQIF